MLNRKKKKNTLEGSNFFAIALTLRTLFLRNPAQERQGRKKNLLEKNFPNQKQAKIEKERKKKKKQKITSRSLVGDGRNVCFVMNEGFYKCNEGSGHDGQGRTKKYHQLVTV